MVAILKWPSFRNSDSPHITSPLVLLSPQPSNRGLQVSLQRTPIVNRAELMILTGLLENT